MQDELEALIARLEEARRAEPFVWESMTPCYKRYVTQRQYDKFRPTYRRWYRPVCPTCPALRARGAVK